MAIIINLSAKRGKVGLLIKYLQDYNVNIKKIIIKIKIILNK